MNISAIGALGALLLATSAAPAVAGGYYDAGPQTPGWQGQCPPPPPGPGPGPGAYQGPPPPSGYDEGPPPEAYADNSGYADSYGDGAIGPGVYYYDGGALVPEAPYFEPGYGFGVYGYGYGGHGPRDRGRGEGRGREGGAVRVWTGPPIEPEVRAQAGVVGRVAQHEASPHFAGSAVRRAPTRAVARPAGGRR